MSKGEAEFVSADDLWAQLAQAWILNESNALILDVRSEGEFSESPIPMSINAPILTDSERHLVGLEYKTSGQDAAVHLGFKLVHAELRQRRVQDWKAAILNEKIKFISCWRGGLRSELAQQWLAAEGIELPRLQGGTKALRRRAINEFLNLRSSDGAFVLYGRTGSGKTEILRRLTSGSSHYGFLDLEGCAHHRGSAFGAFADSPQPSQVNFEYRMALSLAGLKAVGRKILVEGESRMIGGLTVPKSIFSFMSSLPIVVLETPLEERVRRIHEEYFLEPLKSQTPQSVLESFLVSLKAIERRLGGQRYQELRERRLQAFEEQNETLNLEVIRDLLVHYYDPLYDRFLSHQPTIWKRVSAQELGSLVAVKTP